MTILALYVHSINLNQFLQHDQWKVFDFGPNVEIECIRGTFTDITLIDAFKAFISGEGVETTKRTYLRMTIEDHQVLRAIFQATIDVFLAVTQPNKLFQRISAVYYNGLEQLVNQVREEKILKFVRQDFYSDGGLRANVFRMDHPKLKLALDVEFIGWGAVDFIVRYL